MSCSGLRELWNALETSQIVDYFQSTRSSRASSRSSGCSSPTRSRSTTRARRPDASSTEGRWPDRPSEVAPGAARRAAGPRRRDRPARRRGSSRSRRTAARRTARRMPASASTARNGVMCGAAGLRLRVPCLRDVRLPERGHRAGRPAVRGAHPRRRTARSASTACGPIGCAVAIAAGAPARTEAGAVAARRAWTASPTIAWRAARGSSAPPSASTPRGPGPTCAIRPARSASSRTRNPDDPAGIVAPDRVAVGTRVGVAYAGEAWAARPWRFAIAGHRSVSGPASARLRRSRTRARPTDGRPLAGPARVPARPRAARGGDVVPAVAPPGGSPRAVVRPGHRGPPARRDRPGTIAARGATGDRGRGGPRHRPVDRASGARRSPRCRPVPRARRDARCDRAACDVPGRRAATAAARPGSRAACPAGDPEHARSQLRPGRRDARYGLAEARGPARRGQGGVRPAAAAPGCPRRRRARESPSRNRS